MCICEEVKIFEFLFVFSRFLSLSQVFDGKFCSFSRCRRLRRTGTAGVLDGAFSAKEDGTVPVVALSDDEESNSSGIV